MHKAIVLAATLVLAACQSDVPPSSATNSAPTPTTLWGKTTSGMSVADVKRAYPDAAKPDEPTDIADQIGLLMLPDVTINDVAFDAEFYFNKKTRKLMIVDLRPDQELTGADAVDIFKDLRILLSEKYGAPIGSFDDDYPSLNLRTSRVFWLQGNRKIQLMLSHLSPHKDGDQQAANEGRFFVNVDYRLLDTSNTANL